MEMTLNTAMDKIRDEMAGEDAFSPVAEVGEMVTQMLQAAPGIAPAIIDKSRTLKGAYKAIEDAARKKKKGSGPVCIGPAEAAKIIREYYGITDAIMAAQAPAPAGTMPAAPVEHDEFDLDAMLGGF